MKKLDKSLIAIAIFLLIFASAFQAIKWFPMGEISEISSEVSTKSIREMTSVLLFKNYHTIDKLELQRDLEALGYVDKASYGYDNGVLFLNLELPEKAIILKSENSTYLWDGKAMRPFAAEDYPDLDERYISINLDDDYIEYLNRYGIDGKFERLASALFELDEYSTLISRAEYDNNNYTGSGELILFLDELNAELSLSEIQSIERIGDSLKAIEREVGKNPIEAISDERAQYELRYSELVRIKR